MNKDALLLIAGILLLVVGVSLHLSFVPFVGGFLIGYGGTGLIMSKKDE